MKKPDKVERYAVCECGNCGSDLRSEEVGGIDQMNIFHHNDNSLAIFL